VDYWFIEEIMFKFKKFRLILLATIALVVTLIFDLLTRQPDLPPDNIVLADLTDQSVVIAWTTSRATPGGVAISTQPNRLLRTWEFCFRPKKFFADEINSTNHYVVVKNLAADTKYYYRIYSGGRFWKEGSAGQLLPNLKTLPVLVAPTLPNPIFGQILDQQRQPVAGALVNLFLVNSSNHNLITSKTLVSYTDQKGFWQLDLGNLRSFDGQAAMTVASQDDLFVKIYAADGRSQTGFYPLPARQNLGEIVLR
jgi:hypothetical protein